MTLYEFKQTDMYRSAEDVTLCVNGEHYVEPEYYPDELDHLPVVGSGHSADDNSLIVDITCYNWEGRYTEGWIATP